MHRARFLIVFSLMAIGLAFVALLALIPSFVALETNTLSAEEVSAQGSTAVEGMKSMTKSQALLNVLEPIIVSTTSPSVAIARAIELKPKGATVQHIRFVGPSKSIQLGGAATRDVITAYRTALEGSGMFTSVTVPVAALVGSTGQFSITLGGNF